MNTTHGRTSKGKMPPHNTEQVEDAAVQQVTAIFRGTPERSELRQATGQSDEILETVLSSARVWRRFANALRAYLLEHVPVVLDRIRTAGQEEGRDAQAKLFLSLAGVEDCCAKAAAEEEPPDTTVEDMDAELVKNLRELTRADAAEDSEE